MAAPDACEKVTRGDAGRLRVPFLVAIIVPSRQSKGEAGRLVLTGMIFDENNNDHYLGISQGYAAAPQAPGQVHGPVPFSLFYQVAARRIEKTRLSQTMTPMIQRPLRFRDEVSGRWSFAGKPRQAPFHRLAEQIVNRSNQ